MRDISIRVGLILLLFLAYFTVLRPARGVVNELIFHPIAEKIVEENSELTFIGGATSVSNHIWVQGDTGVDQIYFTVPFGLHFLLACGGLVAIKARRKYYGFLVLIQFASGVLSILFLTMTNLISIQFISLADLTIRYLNPLCSLGLVPLAFTLKRQAINERRT